MPGKKKGSKSAKSGKSAGSAKKKGKKSAKSSATGAHRGVLSAEVALRDPDMLDPPAMHNLYYIAHGPVDALEIRGFNWGGATGAKKKKGKKKK